MLVISARNGCASEIKFKGKKVYHEWDNGIPKSELGKKLNKEEWIMNNIKDESDENRNKIKNLLLDWELYENGWEVVYHEKDNMGRSGYKNKHLFYYLQQLGDWGCFEPKELKYLK